MECIPGTVIDVRIANCSSCLCSFQERGRQAGAHSLLRKGRICSVPTSTGEIPGAGAPIWVRSRDGLALENQLENEMHLMVMK